MTTTPDHQRSDSDTPTEAADDRAALRFVQWLFAALAGGSFASILFVLGQGWNDPPALRALACFVAALPLFAGPVVVYGEPRRLYRATKLFGLIPLLGTLLFLAGMTMLIGRAHATIAGVFVAATMWQLIVVANAHHRRRVRVHEDQVASD